MSEEKDDLKSNKVYKFNNTKENWHEFALKFRVIADTRGYYGVIYGKLTPPDEQEEIIVTTEDKGNVLKEKKDKLRARAANKMGYRDLVMSTDGISLNIVENAISDELPKGDLKKAWGLERRWNPKTREDKVEVYTRFLNYKLENTRQRPMDWITFMEKKWAELMNTGHIMDDVEKLQFALFLISCSQGSSALLILLVSFLNIACLHVSFTAYENFYKLSKMHCFLVLTFHFPIFPMSECRNPTIKHIFTYTLVSPFIRKYVTDLFLVIFFT